MFTRLVYAMRAESNSSQLPIDRCAINTRCSSPLRLPVNSCFLKEIKKNNYVACFKDQQSFASRRMQQIHSSCLLLRLATAPDHPGRAVHRRKYTANCRTRISDIYLVSINKLTQFCLFWFIFSDVWNLSTAIPAMFFSSLCGLTLTEHTTVASFLFPPPFHSFAWAQTANKNRKTQNSPIKEQVKQ